MKRKLLGFTKSILLVLLLFAALPAFSAKIYFKNTLGWTDVYVYTYSTAYWNDNGSGSNGIQSGPNKMTLVPGESNIYEYTIDKSFTIVSFTKDSQSGYDNFHNTQACYRGDYSESAPMFTPDNSSYQTINATKYYNNGSWSALSSGGGSASYYLVGDENYFGGWNTTSGKAFTNGEVSVDVSSTNSAAQFKILKSDGTTWYGSTSTVTSSATSINLSTSVSGNAKINLERTGTYTFNMTENENGTITLDVTYPVVTFKVNIVAGDGGSVDATELQVGSTPVDITATANEGYTFDKWTTTDEGITITDANLASTTITATSAGTVTANFKANTSSTTFYLPNSGNNNFERNDNCKFVDGQLTLYLTAGFKFKVCKNSGTETWYGDGSTISATTTKEITTNTGDMTLTVSQPGTYTFKVEEISGGVKLSVTYPSLTHTVKIEAGEGGSVNPTTEQTVGSDPVNISAAPNSGFTFEKWTSSSTGIKIADPYSASTTITATADGTVTANFTATSSDPIYYVVFPDANVGNTARADKTAPNIPTGHTAFRLIPSRNRNAKTLDKDLVSINLKIDGDKGRQLRYDTSGKINFYIIDNSGKYFTKNEAVSGGNDYIHAFPHDDNLGGQKANNGVDYYNTRTGSMQVNKPNYYYTIHKNDAADTKSLTFMFSKNNISNKSYIINSGEEAKTIKEPSNSVDGFGTKAGMKSGNLIVGFLTSRGHGSTYYDAHISKGVYLVGQMNGTSYTHNKNYPMKPILYPLGETDEAKADSIVYSCTVKKGSADWDDFFLSFSTGDKVEDGDKLWNLLLRPSVQNQMDGQALEGGVTFFKNDEGEDNTQQALNPLLSDAQKNRYVSYTIYFNATYSTYRIEFHDGFYIAGAAVSESTSYAPENRIAMSSAELNGVQHYIYTGEFKNGEQFAFFLNEDSYAVNYCEDNQPVSSTTATDAWNVQAPANGADYAFYNRVLYNTTGDTDGKTLGTGKNGMIWGLPTGTYTIRFYNHKEAAGNNQLYTVDKEVKMVNVKSTYSDSSDPTKETTKNEGGWRTFSDDCALLLPNGVTAYYAANVGKGKVYFKEVPNGYIPAHCPVIISNPNLLDGDKKIAFPVRPDGYDVKLADGEENYLVDCYDKPGKVSPEVTIDGKNKYNYFFTNMYKFYGSKVMSGVPLGFWKTFVNADTKKNYTYLSIDTKLNPSRYDEYANTFTYDENATVVSTKAYCFRMVFDEDELDDNTTTGIEKVTDNADVDMKNAVWYNMQGVRISKPAAPGMYICNGKKIVVR